MFTKRSRYKNLGDIVTTDAGGRFLESKRMRLLPEVTGIFHHTVEEVDRLDHLAFKYYKQPGKWWRVCDANPEFMSPRSLLGKEPIVTAQFPVTFDDSAAQPPWFKLLKTLSQMPGVKDVSIKEDFQLEKKTIQHEYEGETAAVEVCTDTYERVVLVTYNHLNVTAADIKKVIENEDERFKVGKPENTGRLGKKIIIPPNTVG